MSLNAELINSIFMKIDRDGSGNITINELNAVFSAFDKDGNGRVTKCEFLSEFSAQFGGTEEQGGRVFGKLDRDCSGDVTIEEITALFREMDKDGNGHVSKTEFVDKWKQLLA